MLTNTELIDVNLVRAINTKVIPVVAYPMNDVELINGGQKLAQKKLEEKQKKGVKNQRVEEYETKEQQSKLYRGQEQECHVWLFQNLNPGKTAAIMRMLEQMAETRSWKEARGLRDDGSCRICTQHFETVEDLVSWMHQTSKK